MKKIISTNTLLTEIIVDDEGNSYIIRQTKENNSHSELITDQFERKQLAKWKSLHELHQKELDKEKQPGLYQLAASGEDYALKNIVSLHQHEKAGEFEVKGIWWDMTLNFLKNQALAFIIGALKGLVKDNIPNMVKLAGWLVEQLENEIVKGYQNLGPDFQGVIKNELKEYPQFKQLLEKLN